MNYIIISKSRLPYHPSKINFPDYQNEPKMAGGSRFNLGGLIFEGGGGGCILYKLAITNISPKI